MSSSSKKDLNSNEIEKEKEPRHDKDKELNNIEDIILEKIDQTL